MNSKTILLILIGLQIFCWGTLLYEGIEMLLGLLRSTQKDPEINDLILIGVIYSAVLFNIVIFDVITFYVLKKEKGYYTRLCLVLSGIISFIAISIALYFSIREMFFSDYPTGYTFHRDQLAAIIILISSIASIVIVFVKKIGTRKKSGQFAEPIDTLDYGQER